MQSFKTKNMSWNIMEKIIRAVEQKYQAIYSYLSSVPKHLTF